jgi:hypothetical protein
MIQLVLLFAPASTRHDTTSTRRRSPDTDMIISGVSVPHGSPGVETCAEEIHWLARRCFVQRRSVDAWWIGCFEGAASGEPNRTSEKV